jgi:hypothetical protein
MSDGLVVKVSASQPRDVGSSPTRVKTMTPPHMIPKPVSFIMREGTPGVYLHQYSWEIAI